MPPFAGRADWTTVDVRWPASLDWRGIVEAQLARSKVGGTSAMAATLTPKAITLMTQAHRAVPLAEGARQISAAASAASNVRARCRGTALLPGMGGGSDALQALHTVHKG